MNKLQIIEYWKSRTGSFSGMQEALDYIYGDDSKFEKIKTINSRYWVFEYDKKLLNEMDGENVETAKRCLRATAALCYNRLFYNSDDIAVLSRIGFTLDEILKSPLETINLFSKQTSCLENARALIKYFPGQAENLITPEYIAGISVKKDSMAHDVAVFIAAELLKSGMSELSDTVYDYAYKANGGMSISILANIYRLEDRFQELLIKNLKGYVSATKDFSDALDDPENTEQYMRDMGLEDIYIFTVLIGGFGKEEKEKMTKIAVNDDRILSMAVKRACASSMHSPDVQVPVGFLLKEALDAGKGKEYIPLFEKTYQSILSNFSINFVNVSAEHFINHVKIDPEKAAAELKFKDRYINFFNTRVICALIPYSKLAHDIIFALLKAAELHTDTNSINAASSVIFCCCHECGPAKEILERFIDDGISINIIFMGISYNLDKIYTDFIKAHIQEAVDFYPEIKNNALAAGNWAQLLYNYADCTDIGLLIELLKNKSKVVSRFAGEIIGKNETLMRPLLEEAMPSFKGETLKKAEAVIKKWDNNRKYGENFTFSTNALAEEFISDNYDKKLEKKISFIPDEYFTGVRWCDLSGEVPADVIKYIFCEYMNLDKPYKIFVCSKLAERFHKPDFYECIENIYQFWLENGADNKTKMILVPYCVFASDSQILAMKKQLRTWAEAMRGALAAFAVKAIAINGSKAALMTVNDISVKFPNNMVKKEAKEAFSYAADVLDIPEDVLADKIVPDLGLDKNGEAVLDYGSRTFIVSLMPDFSFAIYDNAKGKNIKSLPKPSASDDSVKAETAKKYFSDMKKQLKAVTSSQKIRLQDVFRNGRTWNVQAWKELFVDNPIMQRFAKTLVWGIYDNGKLLRSFRYTDDGTFCDENDDETKLPDMAEISIIHPCEAEDEVLEAWTQQLVDYEIIQPFAQLTASVEKITKDDLDEKNHIKKYNGRTFTVGSMTGAAKKYNLVRASVEDAGGYNGYHIQDKAAGLGMQIGSDYLFMGQGYDESVSLGEVYFYRLPEKDSAPYSYNEFPALAPDEISPRFVSCCINILESILD